MTPYRAVLLALFVVGGALTVAVPTGATGVGVDATPGVAVSDDPIEDARPTAAANDTANNSTLGADISSFMQSSAAEVGGAVETGMWTAAFNATENQSVQSRLVERRTTELRTELTELQQRKAELVAEREAGNVTPVAYKAKISRLLGQINALKSAIETTSTRAAQANASVESLDTLRSQTENLTGPEISSVARNITGVTVGNGKAGPPAGVGKGNGVGNAADGNETGPPANVGNGSVSNQTGPPADVGNGSAPNATPPNGTNASAPGGPPDDPGNSPIVGNGSDNETTAPNGSAPGAPGNGTEVGNGTESVPGNGNDAGKGTDAGTGIGNDTGVGNELRTDSLEEVTSTVAATPDLLAQVSDAFGVRIYAVEYTPTVA